MLPFNTGQRRISPLTAENMERLEGGSTHREGETLSPSSTMANVGTSEKNVTSEQSPVQLDPATLSIAKLVLPDALLSGPNSNADGQAKPAASDQTITGSADAINEALSEVLDVLDVEATNVLKEATNKLQTLEVATDNEHQPADDRAATPKPPTSKIAPASTNAEVLPKSPVVGGQEVTDPNTTFSSPPQVPWTGPFMPNIHGSRRTSNAGSQALHGHAAAARAPPRRMSTATSSMTGMTGISRTPLERMDSMALGSVDDALTVYSEATKIRFNEDDRLLERFVNENEPEDVVKQPAGEIPTEVDDSLKHGTYSFVCSFGWVGEEKVDLEETPLNPESYIEKLDDAKDGIRFVVRAVINYQAEINSRGHHKFKPQFLTHQNQACIVVLEQLDEIESHINEVIQEIQGFDENDAELKDELAMAYSHALPWVKRTRRLVSEAHVFYKLNYVLGRQQKTTKVKQALPTIPAGRAVTNAPTTAPNSSLERK